jgi:hypothetical protein
VPRLVAEETYYSSGPVEASRVLPSRLYPKFILWASLPLQNSIDLSKLDGYFFIDFSNVL